MKKTSRRILMVGPYPPPYGGVAIVVRDIIHSSLTKSYNMKTLRTRPSGGNELYRFLFDLCYILKEFVVFKPSIVHIHTSYDFGWIKHISYCILSKVFGKKVILHHHGIPENSNYEAGGKICYLYPPKFGLFFTDHIICISNTIKQKIEKIVDKKKITVVYNGVSKEILNIGRNRKNFLIKDRVNILYIGATSKRKGIIELLNVLKKIGISFHGYKLKTTIIGSGPLDDFIEDFIRSNCPRGQVVRKKVISEQEKIKNLEDHELFILQSDHEGLPIAILESLASGLFVISSPIGGIPEVIDHKINGLLIKPHDEGELINALKWVLDNLEYVESIRKKNIQLVENKYSWENNAKIIGELYNKLLP